MPAQTDANQRDNSNPASSETSKTEVAVLSPSAESIEFAVEAVVLCKLLSSERAGT